MYTDSDNDLATTVSRGLKTNPNMTVKMLVMYLNSKLNTTDLLCKILICMNTFIIISGIAFVLNIIPNKTWFGVILIVMLAVHLMTTFLYNKFDDFVDKDFKQFLECALGKSNKDDETEDDGDETYDGPKVIVENRPFVE